MRSIGLDLLLFSGEAKLAGLCAAVLTVYTLRPIQSGFCALAHLLHAIGKCFSTMRVAGVGRNVTEGPQVRRARVRWDPRTAFLHGRLVCGQALPKDEGTPQ